MANTENADEATQSMRIINSNVAFVPTSMLMKDVVQIMIDRRISSVLVHDHADKVVGIITERDIVHKFTLLDMTDKLVRTATTVMTRPVKFVRMEDLRRDLLALHVRHGVRHFPVLAGKQMTKVNVMGMISITDIARSALIGGARAGYDVLSGTPAESPTAGHAPLRLAVFVHDAAVRTQYLEILHKLHATGEAITDLDQFVADHPKGDVPILFDLDWFEKGRLAALIPVAQKYSGQLFLATSTPQLIPGLQKLLDAGHQEVYMKPINFSYLGWRLSQIWSGHSGSEPEGSEAAEEEES